MRFNSWRNLGVFLVAGVALMGCTSSAQKNKDIIQSKGPPLGEPHFAKGQPKAPSPNFPVNANTGTTGFPTNPNPGLGGGTKATGFPTSPQVPEPYNPGGKSLLPAGGASPSIPNPQSNSSPGPYFNPQIPAPANNGGFATQRPQEPGVPLPVAPQGFPGSR